MVAPTLDMVLGCYYMTVDGTPQPDAEVRVFSSADRVHAATIWASCASTLRSGCAATARSSRPPSAACSFNAIVPDSLGFQNEVMDKKALRSLVSGVYQELGSERTVEFVDAIKDIGFRYATQSGISIAASDISVPQAKTALMASADQRIDTLEEQFQMGLMTETSAIWRRSTSGRRPRTRSRALSRTAWTGWDRWR